MREREDTKPWYKQFWPWFLISLPMTAVIASMITINLAITDKDGLVKDDYYKEGLAVNADMAKKRYAEQLGIAATGIVKSEQGLVEIEFNDAAFGNFTEMTLEMIHPTRSNNDETIILSSTDGKLFTGKLEKEPLPGHWWIRLGPANETWYIDGRMLYPKNKRMNLHAFER